MEYLTDEQMPEEYLTVCDPCKELAHYASDKSFGDDDDRWYRADLALTAFDDQSVKIELKGMKIVDTFDTTCELCNWGLIKGDTAYIMECVH